MPSTPPDPSAENDATAIVQRLRDETDHPSWMQRVARFLFPRHHHREALVHSALNALNDELECERQSCRALGKQLADQSEQLATRVRETADALELVHRHTARVDLITAGLRSSLHAIEVEKDELDQYLATQRQEGEQRWRNLEQAVGEQKSDLAALEQNLARLGDRTTHAAENLGRIPAIIAAASDSLRAQLVETAASLRTEVGRLAAETAAGLAQRSADIAAAAERSEGVANALRAQMAGDVSALTSRIEHLQAELAAGLARRADEVAAAVARAEGLATSLRDQFVGDLRGLGNQIETLKANVASGLTQRSGEIAAAAARAAQQDADLLAQLTSMKEAQQSAAERWNAALLDLRAGATLLNDLTGEQLASIRLQTTALASRLAEVASAPGNPDLAAQLALSERRLQSLEAQAVASAPAESGLGSFASRMLALESIVPRLENALACGAAESATRGPVPAGGPEEAFDRFYLAFENRYRGAREEISRRQAVYLPHVEQLAARGGSGRADFRLADLGCGRGEWLELLHQHGFTGAIGVDSNPQMIEHCLRVGLPVEQSDAMAFLRRQSDRSFTAITGMHIVEHLPFPTLLALLTDARRVLVPGGMIIFETPNCNNILVSSLSFHMDPTHRAPIPPLLLSFAAENAGFRDLTILPLHPYGPEYRVASSTPLAKRFNEFFYGPQDYALIGFNA